MTAVLYVALILVPLLWRTRKDETWLLYAWLFGPPILTGIFVAMDFFGL
jgi:hypothetical protein